jgi:hypothetical protein
MVEGGYYLGQHRPTIDHTSVSEDSDRVLVSTYLRERPFKTKGPCKGLGIFVPATVHLEAPLGTRSIFDTTGIDRTGFNRPTLRWPGPEEWECLRRLPMFQGVTEVDGRPRVSGQLTYLMNTAVLGSPAVTRSCTV